MSDITLTGPAQTNAFRLLSVRRGLKLEIETGMKLSSKGSVMNVAREICGSSKRTKRAVFADYDAWMVAQGFDSVSLRK
jgi:hypothetical protein